MRQLLIRCLDALYHMDSPGLVDYEALEDLKEDIEHYIVDSEAEENVDK